jgi:hypothetical protein
VARGKTTIDPEGRLTNEALVSIGKLSRLESLSLESYVGTERLGRMRFSPDGLRHLSELKELRELHLVGHEVPAHALDFPKLTSLSLGHPRVGDSTSAASGSPTRGSDTSEPTSNLSTSACGSAD